MGKKKQNKGKGAEKTALKAEKKADKKTKKQLREIGEVWLINKFHFIFKNWMYKLYSGMKRDRCTVLASSACGRVLHAQNRRNTP